MKDSDNKGPAKIARIATLTIVGMFVTFVSLHFLFEFGRGFRAEYEKIQKEQAEHQSAKNPEFILKPGARPAHISTHGREISWNLDPVGFEGPPIVKARFILKDGRKTPWVDVAYLYELRSGDTIIDQHTGQRFRIPYAYQARAMEFGVPKEGRTEKISFKFKS